MQKKIIALAVAGLVSGVAFAQSNVTVYGVADAGYTYSKSDNGLAGAASGDYKFSGIRDGVDQGINGSRVGFKGEEALGNGLKAIFLIELRVNIATGDQTQATRQSYVGLNSAKAGTFTVGRLYSAAGDLVGNNSSNSLTTINPANVFQGLGGQQIVSAGGNARQSQALKWVSPNWSGFTTRLSYAFSNTTRPTSAVIPTSINAAGVITPAASGFDPNAETTDGGRWAVSGDYTNGPLNVDLILAKTSSVRTASSLVAPATYALEGEDINEWYVGGAYDFKVVKLFGSYQSLKGNNDTATTLTNSKLWQVGLRVPVGNGRINMEYAKISFEQDNQTAALEQNGNNKGFGIGYEYDFSKRTTAYAYVSQLKYSSDTLASGGLPTIGGGANVGTAALGETQRNLVVGLRHLF